YLVGSPVVVTIQHREAKPMQTPIDHLYAVGTVSIGKIGDAEAISGDARKTRRCDKCRYSGDLLTTLRGRNLRLSAGTGNIRGIYHTRRTVVSDPHPSDFHLYPHRISGRIIVNRKL